MQRFCPNCGDPVEADELFCDKCGTKLESGGGGQSSYHTPQNPIPNYSQQPFNSGQQNFSQQNNQQYTPNPQFQPSYAKPKKSFGKRLLKIILGTIGTIFVLLMILGVIANIIGDDDPVKPPVTPTVTPKVTTQPTVTPKKPTATPTPTKGSQTGEASAAWAADINSNAKYEPSEAKIYVEYIVNLENIGYGEGTNIKVYIDPEENDPNIEYLGIEPMTIVNIEGPVAVIYTGEAKEIKTKFSYDNVSSSTATQENLQKIASTYVTFPILVEWQENGKTYTEKLTVK